jgi:hypothetical protein
MEIDLFKEIKKFADWASDFLHLEIQPTIVPQRTKAFTQHEKSFGGYSPSEKKIYLSVANRNLADVLRSLAHELVHAKQDEEGRLTEESGETGSFEENEANSVAGTVMRFYGRENYYIFDELFLEENTVVSDEMGELERTAKDENISLSYIVDAFEDAELVPLNDAVWSQLENTDSYDIVGPNQAAAYAEDYGKDWKPIVKAIKNGEELPPPLVLNIDDRYILVGGNTRLMFYKALGVTPKVLMGRMKPTVVAKEGAPGTLKAKIKGPVTMAKAKALKNRKNATTLDKKQANWFINMHKGQKNEIASGTSSTYEYTKVGDVDHEYKFSTEENDYVVKFTDLDGGYYERSYNIEGEFKSPEKSQTLENKALKVLSTVTKITVDFLRNPPDDFYVLVIHPIDSRRLRIVKAFMEKALPTGYEMKEEDGGILSIKQKAL